MFRVKLIFPHDVINTEEMASQGGNIHMAYTPGRYKTEREAKWISLRLQDNYPTNKDRKRIIQLKLKYILIDYPELAL